jgi:hypothetical protein
LAFLSDSEKPLAIDLYCGLGGWTEGLQAEGYWVVGFDNVHPSVNGVVYPSQLVIQDVLTLHGSQFKDAALIVGSSPCQEFSYRAMPWSRARALPPPYLGMKLFEAQFRIQREAIEAAGHHIPLVVENVRGAQKWVGRSRWNFGSFHLWGDVPALMPMTQKVMKNTGGSWFDQSNATVDPHNPVKAPGQDWNRFKKTGAVSPDWKMQGQKSIAHPNQRDGHRSTAHLTNPAEHGVKCGGGDWFGPGERMSAMRHQSSRSSKRKQASAMIAKIPLPLAQYIARVYKPVANVKI